MPKSPAPAPDHVIEYRDPRGLIADPHNARTHPQAQVDEIKAGFRRFGFTNPVLLKPSGMIGAGHGRQIAALQMIEAGETIKRTPDGVSIPTITLHGLTDAEWVAYAIADNKIATNSGWDADMLRRSFGELRGLGFDLALTGFSTDEVGTLFAEAKTRGDPNKVPDAPAKPVSQLGDVWILGPHIIVCGDCTDPDTVALALNGFKPHLMVTDPPYGVDYDPAWRNAALGENCIATGAVLNDGKADWREAWRLFPGEVGYIWHADTKRAEVEASLIACGFEVRANIIWAKQHFTLGRGHYHHKHEPALYVVRKGGKGHWVGGRKQSTVWDDIDNGLSQGGPRGAEDAGTGHGTQKPVECMARPIRNNSDKGDRVYEPFSGSGTTIMAAHLNGRICHAVELNPAYVDVAVERWQTYTGETAFHASGASFSTIRGERLGA